MDIIKSEAVITVNNNTEDFRNLSNERLDDDDDYEDNNNAMNETNNEPIQTIEVQTTEMDEQIIHEEIVESEQNQETVQLEEQKMNDFDQLVDKVYGKILDMAKDKNLMQVNSNNQTQCDSEISIEEENRRAYPPQNILTSNTILYGILKHTCLNCSKSFEHAKSLRRHFLLEHILYKPTYVCKYCEQKNLDTLFDLDKYLIHLLSKHNNLDDLQNLYDLFILKYIQDIFTDFFTEGKFYLDPQQIKHINKLKFGKENCTLIQKMHSKIYENYFINDDCDITTCKPPITLTSKSLKSNLLYSQITKAQVFKEIVEYLKIEPQQMNEDALHAYMTVQQTVKNSNPHLNETDGSFYENQNYQMDNYKYNQCKFCMKIFRECNAYKEHVMEAHTFNEFCNRCIVCPHCKQILKSNFDKNADANVLLNVHVKKCLALKSDLSHVHNTFRYTNNLTNLQTALDLPAVPVSTSTYEDMHVHYEMPNGNQNRQSVSKKRTENDLMQNDDDQEQYQQKQQQSVLPKVLKKKQKTTKLPIILDHKTNLFANYNQCYLCEFKVDNPSDYTMEKHVFDEHVLLKCSLCENEILKKAYMEHLNDIHIPECTEICYSCPFSVQTSDECKQHLNLNEFLQHSCITNKLDEYKINLTCPICEKSLKINDESDDNYELLSSHFQQSHSISMFNCELCTASFRNGWFLVEHILCEHKPLNIDNNTFNDDTTNHFDKFLKCFKCDKIMKFTNEQMIKLHDLECNSTTINNNTNNKDLILNGQQTHQDDQQTNSSMFINPLSILSNVSTSVPHILSSSGGDVAVNEITIQNDETGLMLNDDVQNIKIETDLNIGELRSPPAFIGETIIETIVDNEIIINREDDS